MRDTPRFFPSSLTARERRVYGALTAFFGLIFLALTWPVYAWFAGIRPLVLGMPLSMFYIVVVLVVCFLVMLGLYWWERRRGTLEGPEGASTAGDGESAGDGSSGADGDGDPGAREAG